MNLAYRNTHEVVAALQHTKHFPGFHALPYNRYALDRNNVWWLSPTGENPAYRFGKAIFSTSEEWVNPGDVFCGFYVEKGVLKGATKNAHGILKPNWFWHDFVKVAGEPLGRKVEEVRDALGSNLLLGVISGISGAHGPRDIAMLDVIGTELKCRPREVHEGPLAEFSACTSFAQFGAAVKSLDCEKMGWHWIEVMVGHMFTLDPAGSDDLERLAAMLKPFRPWMREAA